MGTTLDTGLRFVYIGEPINNTFGKGVAEKGRHGGDIAKYRKLFSSFETR